jgi:hypothetical protein
MNENKDLKIEAPVDSATKVSEKLSDTDKSNLDLVRMKRELALANAKTALAQSETAQVSYDNIILQLAMKYKLVDGDVISDAGEIQRKSK